MNTPRDSLESKLADFRTSNPLIDCSRGERWQYRRVGSGPDAVLWLTGALGSGDLVFRTIPLIGESFAVLIPDYPDVSTLDKVCDGLIAIMDQEKIDRAHVVGGSLGGMIAQHLVRRRPDRVRSLVLSHTSAPESNRLRVSVARAAVATLPLWAESIVRLMFSSRLRGSFDVGDPFWLTYFDSQVSSQSVGQLMSRVRLAAEFAAKRDYKSDDLLGWGGRVLVLESDDDPMMPEATRRSLRQLYPQASVHTFSRTGHSISLTDPERYAMVIRDFLEAAA